MTSGFSAMLALRQRSDALGGFAHLPAHVAMAALAIWAGVTAKHFGFLQ